MKLQLNFLINLVNGFEKDSQVINSIVTFICEHSQTNSSWYFLDINYKNTVNIITLLKEDNTDVEIKFKERENIAARKCKSFPSILNSFIHHSNFPHPFLQQSTNSLTIITYSGFRLKLIFFNERDYNFIPKSWCNGSTLFGEIPERKISHEESRIIKDNIYILLIEFFLDSLLDFYHINEFNVNFYLTKYNEVVKQFLNMKYHLDFTSDDRSVPDLYLLNYIQSFSILTDKMTIEKLKIEINKNVKFIVKDYAKIVEIHNLNKMHNYPHNLHKYIIDLFI